LAINNTVATGWVSSQPPHTTSHVYTFTINAPGGQLSFGVMDGGAGDNTGQYVVTVFNGIPNSPVLNGISDTTNGNHVISWDSVSGISSYVLQKDNNINFSSPVTVHFKLLYDQACW